MDETLSSVTVCTRLERIAEMARRHPERAFSSIGHVLDIELLEEAYRRTRKDGATGVDRQTAAQYAKELDSNLASLHRRVKEGCYRAPPVRGVKIPKAAGGVRALGVPTFEDKVLQRAVAMVLESIYEQDFLDCSWGFRRGRSAHGALDALWKALMHTGGGWVLEVDIEKFFDTLDHQHLRCFLDRRVTDGVLRRLVHKWLKAGVLEDGAVVRRAEGTPQGGVISPLLANIYLHEVLDVWFEAEVKPRLRGRATLIRYADDFVVVFERREDAERVERVLPKRLARYGLRVHPDKTRLVRFERPRPGRDGRNGDEERASRTFDFLGFTHYWGKSRKGNLAVFRKTASSRLTRALRSVRRWCAVHRHLPLREQHEKLVAKMRGHFGYFGITGNARRLEVYYYEVRRAWYVWLSRRSGQGMPWERYARILERLPLPRPRIVHSALRSANP